MVTVAVPAFVLLVLAVVTPDVTAVPVLSLYNAIAGCFAEPS